ncbi:MAG: hypothetical protein ACOY5B_17860 [Spirochaetota bacterium]
MTYLLRHYFAGLLVFVACMGEKPNGLRADGSASVGAGLVISGLKGDQLSGRLSAASGGQRSGGQAYAQFTVATSDGARHTLSVEPWPVALPQCQAGQCSVEAERLHFPDGVESRLTIARKGKVVALAVNKSRLRALPGGTVLKLLVPSERKSSGERIGIDLRAGETLIERGKSTSLQLEGRQCSLYLFDASVAAEGRPGIAEESAAFLASWVLFCP